MSEETKKEIETPPAAAGGDAPAEAAPAEAASTEAPPTETDTTNAENAAYVAATEDKEEAEAVHEERRIKKEASEELTKRLQKLALERQKVSETSQSVRVHAVLSVAIQYQSIYSSVWYNKTILHLSHHLIISTLQSTLNTLIGKQTRPPPSRAIRCILPPLLCANIPRTRFTKIPPRRNL